MSPLESLSCKWYKYFNHIIIIIMNIIIIIIIIIIWCPISVVVALAKCEVQQALGPGIITGPEPAKTFEDGLQMKDKSNGQLSLFFFSARGRRGRRRRRSSRRNRRSRKKRTLVAPPPHTHTPFFLCSLPASATCLGEKANFGEIRWSGCFINKRRPSSLSSASTGPVGVNTLSLT